MYDTQTVSIVFALMHAAVVALLFYRATFDNQDAGNNNIFKGLAYTAASGAAAAMVIGGLMGFKQLRHMRGAMLGLFYFVYMAGLISNIILATDDVGDNSVDATNDHYKYSLSALAIHLASVAFVIAVAGHYSKKLAF